MDYTNPCKTSVSRTILREQSRLCYLELVYKNTHNHQSAPPFSASHHDTGRHATGDTYLLSPATTVGVMQSPGGGGWLVTKTNSTTLLLKGQELKLDELLLCSAMRVINLSYHAAVGTALSRSRFHHSKLKLQMNLTEFQRKGKHTGPPRGFKKSVFFLPGTRY
jgi:hypothetical protein